MHATQQSPVISTAADGATYKGILLLTKEKMVSSVIMYKMSKTDTGAKSNEIGSALSIQSHNTQANEFHIKQSLNNNRPVCTSRCNTFQSHTGGIRVPSEENSVAKLHQTEKAHCSNIKKDFSYITVTARRITSPSSTPLKPDAAPLGSMTDNRQNFLRASVFSVKNLQQTQTTDGDVFDGKQQLKFNSRNASTLKVSGTTRPALNREMHYNLETRTKDSKGLITNIMQKNTLSKTFISCIHHNIPQVFSSSLYCIDRSLPFSLTQPRDVGKVHRSELTVKICPNSASSTFRGKHERCNTESPYGHTKQGFGTKMTFKNNVKVKNSVIKSQKLLHQQIRVQNLEIGPVPDCKLDLNGQPDAISVTKKITYAGSERQRIFGSDRASENKQNKCHLFVSELYAQKGVSRTSGSSAKSCGVIPVRKRNPSRCFVSDESTNTGLGYTTILSGKLDKICHSEKSIPFKKIPSNLLTLREALELYRPDFIYRSKERIEKLKLQIEQRRTHQRDGFLQYRPHYGSLPNIPLNGSSTKKQCTVPRPTCDNLYKPRERMISGKEMQMRSKRIYNKLPEVKRRKEEEKKKLASQTNRLRAEIFKKKLLDQILQRNTDRE
ncbi:(E2-independent) E3 ubiquitin-conjugating enzyme FATS [Protopterus annectens]|uniref:(E2-independent) E3 ubiquitin-conjugating enzyme FATS n=1 Tax=Protopterus annectens TaxID=7888 RepID=UPI001CFB5294|nr:(E2-independent) E3 ubiquitin-conjugating enzyme FATS [Protopterus annectens]